jgi:O-antigen/teichoic acid export membrane protein
MVALNYAVTLIGFVTGPIMARQLGPAGRGQVAVVVTYSILVPVVLGLGVAVAVRHFVAQDPSNIRPVVAATTRLAVYLLPLSLLVTYACILGPLHELSAPARIGGVVLLGLTPIALVSNNQASVVLASGNLRALGLINVIPVATMSVGIIVLGVTGTLSVGAYLAVLVFAWLLQLAVGFAYVPFAWRAAAPIGPIVRFGVRGVGGQVAEFATLRLDQALMLPLVGTAQLGLYAVAVTLALIPLTVSRAMAYKGFAEVARRPPEHRLQEAVRVIRWTAVTSFGVAAGMAVGVPLLLPLLYGPAYRGAVTSFLILLPGTLFFGTAYAVSNSLVVTGRPGRVTLSQAAGLTVSGILIYPVIGTYGIIGASVLSTGSYLVTLLVSLKMLGPAWRDVVPRVSDVVQITNLGRRRVRRLWQVRGSGTRPAPAQTGVS